MTQVDASRLDAEPGSRKAARKTVGDRLMQALRPSDVSSTPLRWFGLAMLALAAVFPLVGGPFYTRLAIETLLLGSLALSVDILLGYAGLLSLGQAAYFGLAAYISALMYLHVTQSFWLVFITVVAAVGVFSLHPRRRRDPRQGRLFRADHLRRRRDSLQDRAQHARDRRLGRPARHSGSDHPAVSRLRASTCRAISSSTTSCSARWC